MEEKIIPTRMELLKKKAQIKLAKKGHKLLKKKRDALIMEFFKILKKARDLRKELYEKLEEAKKSLYYASLFADWYEIDMLAGLTRGKFELEVREKNVMGVKVPSIKYESKRRTEYPEFLSSAQMENIAIKYREMVDIIVKIAEVETSIIRILKEIEKTKRRVNALEYIVIPRLEKALKEIRQRLEEIERDSFVALKTIKRRLEKEKKAA